MILCLAVEYSRSYDWREAAIQKTSFYWFVGGSALRGDGKKWTQSLLHIDCCTYEA
jgi:hypothetical protein